MDSHNSHPQLSRPQTDAITMNNRLNAPFLRLPAEIRNRIYDYVLGGLIIDSTPPSYASPPARPFREVLRTPLRVRIRQSSASISSYGLRALLDLLLVCRQIYSETRALPFKLNEFQISSTRIQDFLHSLSSAQRDAISSFRILAGTVSVPTRSTSPAMMMDYLHLVTVSVARHHEGKDGNMDPEGVKTLGQMKGLKRVVVEDWSRLMGPGRLEEEKEKAEEKIYSYIGRRDVEVVFE